MTLILEDVFEVEFTNIQNLFLLKDILNNEGITIVEQDYDSIICQHKDYNVLLFATHLYLESLENILKLEELL